MLKVIIVDDDEATRAMLRNYVNKTEFLELIAECTDGIDAANVVRKKEVDLLLLDIEMPGMDGMELIESLSDVPQIILVTSQEKYAIQAFEYNVTDYLLKPIQYGRFLKSVQRALDNKKRPSGQLTVEASDSELDSESEKSSRSGKYIFIKVKSQLVKISTEDILWVQAKGDYVDVKCQEKTYTIHSTMKNIEDKLPGDVFQRAHRSYIVNTDKIKLIDEGMIVIADRLIPVGNKYQKELMKKLNTLK